MVAALSTLVLALALQPAERSPLIQPVTLQIQVRSAGESLAGAEVVVAGKTFTTAANGIASVTVTPGRIEITAAKEGYLPATVTVTISAARPNQSW